MAKSPAHGESVPDEQGLEAVPKVDGVVVQLSPNELRVYEALVEAHDLGAQMYAGAMIVRRLGVPDGEAMVAHAMRELLDTIPEIAGVEAVGNFSHRSRVGQLRGDWHRAVDNSDCTSDGTTWSGKIDGALARFLKRTRQFFEDEANAHMPGLAGAREFVSTSEPTDGPVPPVIIEQRALIWADCKGYFSAVSHHDDRKSIDDLDDYVTRVEDFLLDHLKPRTTADRIAIAQAIKEIESR